MSNYIQNISQKFAGVRSSFETPEKLKNTVKSTVLTGVQSVQDITTSIQNKVKETYKNTDFRAAALGFTLSAALITSAALAYNYFMDNTPTTEASSSALTSVNNIISNDNKLSELGIAGLTGAGIIGLRYVTNLFSQSQNAIPNLALGQPGINVFNNVNPNLFNEFSRVFVTNLKFAQTTVNNIFRGMMNQGANLAPGALAVIQQIFARAQQQQRPNLIG